MTKNQYVYQYRSLQMLKHVGWFFVALLSGTTNAAKWCGVNVGERCRIYTRHLGTEPWLITIGNHVTVASGVVFLTHDGATWLIEDEEGRRYRYASIQVGDDVFIGTNSVILPGIKIGNQVVVAAGSIVTKSIPDGSVVGGNPARIIGSYEEYKQRVLTKHPCSKNMKGTSYRERIDSIAEK